MSDFDILAGKYMDATISAQLLDIVNKLEPLHRLQDPFYKQPEFIGAALGSFVAVMVSVVGWVYHERFSRRTKIKTIRVERFNQTSYIFYRLVIKNMWGHTARSVEINSASISDNDVVRTNLLPAPLVWTHSDANLQNIGVRDIHPNQTVYLDLCRLSRGWQKGHVSPRRLFLLLQSGMDIDDYSLIKQGNSLLELKLFQESGQTLRIWINITMLGEDDPTFEILNFYNIMLLKFKRLYKKLINKYF